MPNKALHSDKSLLRSNLPVSAALDYERGSVYA